MEIFQKNKKIFLFVGIFAVVVIIYWLFFSGDSSSPQNSVYDPTAGGLVSEFSVSPSDAIIGYELLATLARLKSISLDPGFFSDTVFVSLRDKSKPIVSQPLGKSLGRRNPFSDFGKGVATTSVFSPAGILPPNAFGTPKTQ
ncbi:MAG: hypothetical protein Q7S86_04050 [bacterium]|nr:hypothetical protein [bacterium]